MRKTSQEIPEMAHQDQRLNFDQVSSLTGLKRTSIYALIKQGIFPKPVKMGPRCSRWKYGEVIDAMKKHETYSPAEANALAKERAITNKTWTTIDQRQRAEKAYCLAIDALEYPVEKCKEWEMFWLGFCANEYIRDSR